jgi:hypothetical protein
MLKSVISPVLYVDVLRLISTVYYTFSAILRATYAGNASNIDAATNLA